MIRAVGEFHSLSPAQQQKPDSNQASIHRTGSLGAAFLSKAPGIKRTTTVGGASSVKPPRPLTSKPVANPADNELHNIKDALNTVDEYHATVVETLEVSSKRILPFSSCFKRQREKLF